MTAFSHDRRSLRPERVFASSAARDLLCGNELSDIDAVFARAVSAQNRHPGRAVFELSLLDSANKPHRAFVKINWGRRRLWPRMTDLRTGQLFWSHPAREWHGLEKLESLGLPLPERLAFFEEGRVSFRSAVIVRAVPPPKSIYDMLLDGSWHALRNADRRTIVDEIIATLDCIHAGQLGWRGTSTGHFYPEPNGLGGWRLWLIDCEGVHTRATPQTVQRDFRKIARCLARAGADSVSLEHLRIQVEQKRQIRLDLPAVVASREAA